jgi:uncharacterized ion transporter superfamily protein YfcC
MWLSAIKLAVSAGSKIYANKQRTKMAMSDAQLMHAEKMARGDEAYQGKLLEARQSDYKDEAVLIILTLPILVLAYGVFSDDVQAMDKIKVFFEHFQALPQWFTNLWILVVASIYGIKGTQIFRNGGKK